MPCTATDVCLRGSRSHRPRRDSCRIRPQAQRAREGVLPGALAIERNVLEPAARPVEFACISAAVDHDVEWVVVCSEGYTSSLAASALQQLVPPGHRPRRWISGTTRSRSGEIGCYPEHFGARRTRSSASELVAGGERAFGQAVEVPDRLAARQRSGQRPDRGRRPEQMRRRAKRDRLRRRRRSLSRRRARPHPRAGARCFPDLKPDTATGERVGVAGRAPYLATPEAPARHLERTATAPGCRR